MKKEFDEIHRMFIRSDESNKMLQNQSADLAEEIVKLRTELTKLSELIQRQDKALAAAKENIYEDKLIIDRMEAERKKLANHITELENDMHELADTLTKEKNNTVKLEEIICALNIDRKRLEDQVNVLRYQQNTQGRNEAPPLMFSTENKH